MSEGVIEGAQMRLKAYFRASWKRRVLGRILQSALRDFASEIDWRKFGGAPLLGLNGVVVLSHGRADAIALCEAIRCARVSSQRQLTQHIQRALESSPYRGNLSATSELTVMRSTEEG